MSVYKSGIEHCFKGGTIYKYINLSVDEHSKTYFNFYDTQFFDLSEQFFYFQGSFLDEQKITRKISKLVVYNFAQKIFSFVLDDNIAKKIQDFNNIPNIGLD
jgi:hypothetical protein